MSLSRRQLIVICCALAMLVAQLTGAHYHRHLGDLMHAEADVTSVHLRDAGVHLGHDAHDHDATDRAAHPGVDLEIDAAADGLAKVFKSALLAGALLVLLLWRLAPVVRPRPRRPSTSGRPGRSLLFVLRPPSHAPPAPLSIV